MCYHHSHSVVYSHYSQSNRIPYNDDSDVHWDIVRKHKGIELSPLATKMQ